MAPSEASETTEERSEESSGPAIPEIQDPRRDSKEDPRENNQNGASSSGKRPDKIKGSYADNGSYVPHPPGLPLNEGTQVYIRGEFFEWQDGAWVFLGDKREDLEKEEEEESPPTTFTPPSSSSEEEKEPLVKSSYPTEDGDSIPNYQNTKPSNGQIITYNDEEYSFDAAKDIWRNYKP